MSFTIGLSGLNAATTMMRNAASDTARATVPVSQPQTDPTPDRPAAAARAAPPATSERSVAAVSDSPGDDITTSMIKQMQASATFMANVETVRHADQMAQATMQLNRDAAAARENERYTRKD